MANKPVIKRRAEFTDLQGQYLAFIQAYTTLQGVAPAEADIQRFFRVTPPTVHRMVLALEQRRLLERVPGQGRRIRLLLSSDAIPKLGGMELTAPSNRRLSRRLNSVRVIPFSVSGSRHGVRH
jgi:SOS-response transcriptional repressor LexA